jgi:hypothetical protein
MKPDTLPKRKLKPALAKFMGTTHATQIEAFKVISRYAEKNGLLRSGALPQLVIDKTLSQFFKGKIMSHADALTLIREFME